MFKLLTSGNDLTGKVIKYCNLYTGIDVNEHNIICTENNEILFFNITHDYRMVCYSEQQFIRSIATRKDLANELLENNIISKEELKSFRKEVENRNKNIEEKSRQERYKRFLELKKEFEPLIND